MRLTALAALVLGALALHGAQPARAAALPEYVTGLKVVSGNSSSVSCGAGWTRDTTDLNKGAGGKYVYACYTVGNSSTYEQFYAVGGRTRDVACKSPTDRKLDGANNYGQDGNLNAGAGGQYIFFCLRPWSGQGSLKQFEFIVISGSTPEWLATSSAKTKCGLDGLGERTILDLKDLNDTVGGYFIYTCLSLTGSGNIPTP